MPARTLPSLQLLANGSGHGATRCFDRARVGEGADETPVLASLRDARRGRRACPVNEGCRCAQPLATGCDGSAIGGTPVQDPPSSSVTGTPQRLHSARKATRPMPHIFAACPELTSPSSKYFNARRKRLLCSTSARLFACNVKVTGNSTSSKEVMRLAPHYTDSWLASIFTSGSGWADFDSWFEVERERVRRRCS